MGFGELIGEWLARDPVLARGLLPFIILAIVVLFLLEVRRGYRGSGK